MRYLIYLVFLSNLSCSPFSKYSQSNRQFEEEVSILERLDIEEKAAEKDILFIGSSSIRLWDNINDDMYLMMRYPTLDEVGLFLKLDFEPNQGADAAELLFDVMVSCIDCLVNGDEVQKMSDFSKEEVRDFIETFPGGTIDNLKNFFETIPTLRYDATYTNSEGEEKTVVLEGTETFFL